jgi:hypothetical protein
MYITHYKEMQPMKPNILIRLLFAALQSKGRLGKSWFALVVSAWLDYRGISWAGHDLDDAHGTFSSRYPNVKKLKIADEITGLDELVKVFRAALSGAFPVYLCDTRAQLSPLIADCITRTKFFDLAASAGLRMTLLVFVADDDDSLRSLIEGMQQTGTSADYLAIRTPALYGSRRYDGSPLQRTLLDAGAQEITMPVLMESTRRAISRAEAACKRSLSFPEAVLNLTDFARADLEYFLAAAFLELDRVSSLLLPTKEAASITQPTTNLPKKSDAFGLVSINLHDE